MADPETGADQNGPGSRWRTRLLALIATLLVIAALRSAYAVAMPVAFAAVIVAALWPVKPRLVSGAAPAQEVQSLAAALPETAWQQIEVGEGSQGPRILADRIGSVEAE